MKKTLQTALATCLAACLCASSAPALADAPMLSIADLRAQTPQCLTQTYETSWRTISVDAPIELPQTDAVPVLELAFDCREPLLTAEQSGWDEVKTRAGMTLMLDRDELKTPKKLDGRAVSQSPKAVENWYDGFTPDARYVPMCDASFGEICDLIRDELTRFGFDANDYAVDSPKRLWAQHWFFKGTSEDALPGHVLIGIRQRIGGIPVLEHVLEAVGNHAGGERRSDEYSANFELTTGFDGRTGKVSHLFVNAATVASVVADDVPLCDFATVQAALEREIDAGCVRKVYALKLGYLLYNQPNVYRKAHGEMDAASARFYAKPVWQADCLYVDSPKAELRANEEADERNSLDYRQLFFDAQTGEPIEESAAHDRCEYKGYLSWKEVQ